MIGRRNLLANGLGRLGAIQAIGAFRAKFSSGIPILAYHRILDVPDECSFPFDIELVSASVAAFESQMEYIKERFKPISFATLLQYLDRGDTPPPGSIIVTFDDGFSDNYYNAFPVLKRLDIPATIFLSSGYVENHEMFWYEKLCFAIMTTKVKFIAAPDLPGIPIHGTPASRRIAMNVLMRRLKTIKNEARVRLLDDIFGQLLADHDSFVHGNSCSITWDQAREMSAHQIEFGSHSVTHPVLSMLDETSLKYELEHSKLQIESALNKPVQVVAYPVGGGEAFNEKVRNATQVAGYRLGVSYISGVDKPAQWDAYAVRRLHVERYVDLPYFKAMLAIPEWFAY